MNLPRQHQVHPHSKSLTVRSPEHPLTQKLSTLEHCFNRYYSVRVRSHTKPSGWRSVALVLTSIVISISGGLGKIFKNSSYFKQAGLAEARQDNYKNTSVATTVTTENSTHHSRSGNLLIEQRNSSDDPAERTRGNFRLQDPLSLPTRKVGCGPTWAPVEFCKREYLTSSTHQKRIESLGMRAAV